MATLVVVPDAEAAIVEYQAAADTSASAIAAAPANRSVRFTMAPTCPAATPSLLAWSDWHGAGGAPTHTTPMEEWTGWHGAVACDAPIDCWGQTVESKLRPEAADEEVKLAAETQVCGQGQAGVQASPVPERPTHAFSPIQGLGSVEAGDADGAECSAAGDQGTSKAQEVGGGDACCEVGLLPAPTSPEVARVLNFGRGWDDAAAATAGGSGNGLCWKVDGDDQPAALQRHTDAAPSKEASEADQLAVEDSDMSEFSHREGDWNPQQHNVDAPSPHPQSDLPLASVRPLYSFMTPSQGWAGNGFLVRARQDDTRGHHEAAAIAGEAVAGGEGFEQDGVDAGAGSPWRRALLSPEQRGEDASSHRRTSALIALGMADGRSYVAQTALMSRQQLQGPGVKSGLAAAGAVTAADRQALVLSVAPVPAMRAPVPQSSTPVMLPSYVRNAVAQAKGTWRDAVGFEHSGDADAPGSVPAAGSRREQGHEPGWRSIVRGWRDKLAAGARSMSKVQDGGVRTPQSAPRHERAAAQGTLMAPAAGSSSVGRHGAGQAWAQMATPQGRRTVEDGGSRGASPAPVGSGLHHSGSGSPWDVVIEQYNKTSSGSRRTTK